jgi:hypothetical protein
MVELGGSKPGPFCDEFFLKRLGEEMVIAVPAAFLIERYHEQAGPLDPFQHRLAARTAGHRVAQFAAQPVEHGRLEQEVADVGGEPLENLLGQVVEHVPVAAAEDGDECVGVRLAAHGQPASWSAAAQPSVLAVSLLIASVDSAVPTLTPPLSSARHLKIPPGQRAVRQRCRRPGVARRRAEAWR